MTPNRPSSPLLAVKHAIPPVRGTGVSRARLERRLDNSAGLTVVSAPAGWGKTSLVARWALATAARAPVAWVSLDEGDDEPVRFWSYVFTALRGAGEHLSVAPLEALLASSDGPVSHALPLLLNELTAAAVPHVLVLDDFHTISDPGIHEAMEFFVSYLPPTLRIVIASRFDPPLPLARMRVRGELAELRAEDLRFTADEATALVTSVASAELPAADSELILVQSEGWAAGLQLAGLALRDRLARGIEQAPAQGSDRHLFDYFTAEVLPALAPDQRDLLSRSAALELLSGSLCDTALDVTGSAGVLAALERADLFVVALDDEHEWFRCHRLLRAALGWSPSSPDATARRVLSRAASWFEQHGRIDDAVRHLLDAGEHEAAGHLLQDRQQWFLERGWASGYLALGERLPEHLVHPELALFLTYAAEVSGYHDRVPHWLDVCDRQIDEHTVVPGWRSARAAELSLRGVLAMNDADPEATVALCERAVALEAAAGTPGHPVALMALGRAHGLAGRFAQGARILDGCWALRGRGTWSTGVDLQVAGVLSLHLLAAQEHGRLDEVLAEAAPAADDAERGWGPESAGHLVVLLRLVQGRRHYERGEHAQARTLLERGMRAAELAGRAMYVLIGLLWLADLDLAEGHRADARAGLARADELVQDEPVAPFLRGWLVAAQNRVGRVAVKVAAETGALFEPLTDRELSILRMLPGLATQREIGAALYLSINTVKAYNKSLYRKLAVGSRTDAVRVARGLGLI